MRPQTWQVDDDAFERALPHLAPTLAHLDVRATQFGDRAALALAEAGCNLARLNASCTELSGRGLAALSAASDRLRMLDLCYAQGLR